MQINIQADHQYFDTAKGQRQNTITVCLYFAANNVYSAVYTVLIDFIYVNIMFWAGLFHLTSIFY